MVATAQSLHQKLDYVSILLPLAIQSRLACHFLNTLLDIEGRVLVHHPTTLDDSTK